MFAIPGRPLLFMGGELGQWREWNHDSSIDWDLLKEPLHQGASRLIEQLNRVHRECPAFR